jgi:hypothetical protein
VDALLAPTGYLTLPPERLHANGRRTGSSSSPALAPGHGATPAVRNRLGWLGAARLIDHDSGMQDSSLSGTFAGCVYAAGARDGQLIRVMELAVVVRSVPHLSV